ncbi:MAG: thiamine phosphate synthase [Pyrinomonadaceae bacterium]
MPERPLVYCISEGLADESNFTETQNNIVERIRRSRACGVTHFQIREKKLAAANLFELSRKAAKASAEAGIKLLVNGRADIALAAGADGVHLPSDGLPIAGLKHCVPASFLIAASVHTLAEAMAAKAAGASMVTFGPVFASPGKGSGVGIEMLAEVCDRLGNFPVIALGGIDEDRIAEVIAGGAAGFAAIRYLNECLRSGKRVPV